MSETVIGSDFPKDGRDWDCQRCAPVAKREVRQGPDGKFLGRIARTLKQATKDFWARVDIRSENECWEWRGGRSTKRNGASYGIVWIGKKQWKSHQFAFFVTHGTMGHGIHILHHCDNPPCCNPKHLFAGDAKMNRDDCVAKGRHNSSKGEHQFNAKLTDAIVRQMRSRYVPRSKAHSASALAREFQVDCKAVWNVVNRKTWKHIL